MLRMLLTGFVVLASIAPAIAGSRHRAERYDPVVSPGGVGCYWHRQRHYCARYCYIEVDGYRYCTERAREAHTQAPVDYPPVVLWPMK